jgi:PASTA domain
MLRFSTRVKAAVVVVAGAVLFSGTSTTKAATVTLGSPLINPLASRPIAISATVRQTALPGATLVAPFNGQIESWRLINASGGWALQVLHPSGGGFVSTGSAHSGTLGSGIATFTSGLPINAGDSIGLASDSGSSALGTNDATPGAAFNAYVPPLTDDTAPRTPSTSAARELGFNATIVSNCIVPKVTGKTVKKAARKLRAAGCKVKAKNKHGSRVMKQKPRSGAELPPGTPVRLTLGS